MNKININTEMSQNFIDFAHEANGQRAFADARDGLKPGQRACIWEMHTKGYSSNKPHVKSAKISGGTIATWWPHGDVAIYNTFARMSQSWINNIPEIDWHGANGSIQISGEPAASRYTEARLSKATEEGLLQNIKKHNVPMKLNFSEDEEWPEVLPALIPRLMVNGCQGIGSTIANVWLPHSLNDLAEVINNYLATGKLDYSTLAPSFPTGGIIINKNDVYKMYETGKGKAIVRGKAEIKGNCILITEVPYQVYVEPLIDQIKELIQKDELKGISNILNKSDKKKLLIEIECDDNPGTVLGNLYRKTDLEKSYSANQFALVGKTPKLLTLKEYLDIYIQHNYDCIKREYEYELNKARSRLEIVIGLIKALEDIDNIIALIKASESSADAVKNLIAKYEFTERQAKAIVDMKLGRLAHLEKVELNKEKEELTSTIATCEEIINSKDKQKEIYLTRFNAFVKKYDNPRKTELAQIEVPKEEKEIAYVEPEDVVVICTQSGDIKRVPKTSFKVQKRNGKGVKTQDDAILSSISTNTIDTLLIFTSAGRMFRLLVDNVPTGTNASKGVNLATLLKFETNEKVMYVTSQFRETNAQFVVFFTKNGLIKKTKLEEFKSTKKTTGIQAIKFKEGDSLANVTLLNEEEVVVLTKNGMIIRFGTKDIAAIGRIAAGVKSIKLKDGDEVLCGLPLSDNNDLAIFCTNGLGKRVKRNDIPIQNRGGVGLIISETKIAGACMVDDTDNIFIIGRPNSICINAKDISVSSRTAAGVQIVNGSKIERVIKL